MTWDAYSRRTELLRDVIALADRRRDLTLSELLDSVEGARAAFPTDLDLLFDLQMTWFQRLSGQVDRLTTDADETPELVAITAWTTAAAEMPGTRTILDAHRDVPELQKAFAKEQALLATAAGVRYDHPELAVHGRRIQQSARDAVVYPAPETFATDVAGHGIIARLRSVLAA